MIWILVSVCLILLWYLYDRLSRVNTYWVLKGVPGPEPCPFIGNMVQNITGKKSFGELCLEWSREFDYKPLLGLYNFVKPFLMVHGVDYVEAVMIKNFSHFMDRAPPPPSKVNLSDQFLFIATGKKWKALRYKLTPVFTTGKLKGMVSQMSRCFHNTHQKIKRNSSVEIRSDEFIQSYIIDVTANIVFGIESSDLSDRDSIFWSMSQRMFQFNWKRFVSFVLYFVFPELAAIFKIPFVPSELTAYFQKIVEQTTSQRRNSGVKRNDIIQLLLELKDKGHVHVDTWDEADEYLKIDEHNKTTAIVEMTDELLTSQAMIFLTTGFDTMSTVLTFTLVELASNEAVMKTLVQEIDDVLGRHEDFTYDALKDMKYLEMCLMEAMRLHPPIPAFLRYCTKDYVFDCGTRIEKGTTLVIPVLAIHMDPNVYADPDRFEPKRFSNPPKPGSYLPFGDGPRICMAKRFAMLEMKMMLAKLLHAYQVRLSSKTDLPVSTEKWNFLSKPNSHVYFKMYERNHR